MEDILGRTSIANTIAKIAATMIAPMILPQLLPLPGSGVGWYSKSTPLLDLTQRKMDEFSY